MPCTAWAGCCSSKGRRERALPLLEQNLTLCRGLGDPLRLAKALNVLGMAHRHLGQLDAAQPAWRRAWRSPAATPTTPSWETVLNHLASSRWTATNRSAQWSCCGSRSRSPAAKGDTFALAFGRLNLAAAIGRAGRPAEAEDLLRSLVADAIDFGDVHLIASTLDELAEAALALHHDLRAARLLGAADRLREQIRIPRSAPDARHLESVGSGARPRRDAMRGTPRRSAGRAADAGRSAVAFATAHQERGPVLNATMRVAPRSTRIERAPRPLR